MPAIYNYAQGGRMRALAIFHDKNGKPRRLQCIDRLTAELTILSNWGGTDRSDVDGISCWGVVEWYLERQVARGHGDSTKKGEREVLENHLIRHLGSTSYADIKPADYLMVRTHLENAKMKPNTIHGYSNIFERVNNHAILAGIVDVNHAGTANETKPKARRIEDVLQVVTERHLVAIRSVSTPREGAVVALFADAAAEATDIPRLEWTDVDFVMRTVRFRGAPTTIDPDGAFEARSVPMEPELAAALLRWRFASRYSPSKLVFPNMNVSKPMRFVQVRAGLVRNLSKQTGRQGAKAPKTPADGYYSMPTALYLNTSFRHRAAIRWASKSGLKLLSYRLGVTVDTAEKLYGNIYTLQFAKEYLLSRRAKGVVA